MYTTRQQYIPIITFLSLFIFTLLKECNGTCPSTCVCFMLMTDCSHNQINNLPKSINIEVGVLNLSYNEFTTVPANISAFTGLERLSLKHNRINALGKHSLDGMDNLKELDLSENCFKRYSDIHPLALQSAKSLLHLDLSHNILTGFPDIKSTTLEKLDLNNCSLKLLHNRALDDLPNLQTLNIGGNKFQSINSPPSSAKLSSLNLTDCDIQSILWYNMDRMPVLTHLHLARNYHLKTFNANSTSLKYLYLADCNLESLPKCFMPNLIHLDLMGNHIRKVDAFSFLGMTNVQQVNLEDNSIEIVHKLAFANASHLQILDISHNTIRSLHSRIFESNNKLEIVRLSRNYFVEMIPFRSASIMALDLRNCEITKIAWNSLINMNTLLDLNLSGNQFTALPLNLTSKSLYRLHVSNCRLTTLKNATFQYAPIYFLDITGNRLVDFQFTDFHSIRSIRISDNPWRCECDKKSFEYDYKYLEKIDSDVDSARCQTPQHLEGLTWSEACGPIWFDLNLNPDDKAWLVSLTLMLIFVIGCCGFITINRECHRRRNRQLEIERRQEVRERLVNLLNNTTRRIDEDHEATNAPDPRELQRPPSYTEAIAMPPLGSTMSLSSRKCDEGTSIATGLNNNNTSTADVKQKVRTKRRRKSPHRSQASEISELSQSNPELADKAVSSNKTRRRRRRSASRERQNCDSSDTGEAESSYVETDV